jgi:hypothetical protein
MICDEFCGKPETNGGQPAGASSDGVHRVPRRSRTHESRSEASFVLRLTSFDIVLPCSWRDTLSPWCAGEPRRGTRSGDDPSPLLDARGDGALIRRERGTLR